RGRGRADESPPARAPLPTGSSRRAERPQARDKPNERGGPFVLLTEPRAISRQYRAGSPMKILIQSFGILLLVSGISLASEEDILPAHTVSLTANAAKPVGEVRATLETAGVAQGRRITAITLTVGGKKIAVPKEQFRDLRNPLLTTAE